MRAANTQSQPEAGASGADQFIPVRKRDIIDVLLAAGDMPDAVERRRFAALCHMLGAIYHYTYFDQLERLRADYYYFNPEIELPPRHDAATLDHSYGDLREALEQVLEAANFVEVSQAEIERAHREDAELRVALRTPAEDFREVRFFRRGRRKREIEVADWWGLRKRRMSVDVYDDVVLFVSMKGRGELGSARSLKRLHDRKIRPGSVLIKYFRNIASADLNALYPNVRVVMSLIDKLVLGIPAVVGGVPIVLNLLPTVSVLFLVIGFYLGISGAVNDDDLKKALAALSGLVALGGFLLRQWVKYQRQALQYQKLLSDNVYFRNINNNAGIFDYLIGAAEEQECKEAFLAYYFIHTAPAPPTQQALDRAIERWLKAAFGLDINFDVGDALAKLARLGLLQRTGDALSVPPPEQAMATLDRVWDDFLTPDHAVGGPAHPVQLADAAPAGRAPPDAVK